MDRTSLLLLAADAILLLHLLFVGFVVLGLPLVWLGGWLGWGWVRNLWFRLTHLGAIGVVVVQAWLGELCPLTTWEMSLRDAAGDAVYSGSFVSHWLGVLLYYRAPAWVFVLAYTLFAAVVLVTWLCVPPRRFRLR